MCNIESLPLDCINHIKYYLCDFKKLEQSCVKYYEYLYELQIMKLFYNTNWRFKNKIQKYDVSIVLDTLIDYSFFNMTSQIWYNNDAKSISKYILLTDSNMKQLYLCKKHSFEYIIKQRINVRKTNPPLILDNFF